MLKRTIEMVDLTDDDDPQSSSKSQVLEADYGVEGAYASPEKLREIQQYLNVLPPPAVQDCDCELRSYESWKAWVERGMPYDTMYWRMYGMSCYATYRCNHCTDWLQFDFDM